MDRNVIRKLRDLEQFARGQSVSPYNNSGKERHVRELFLEIANKLNGIIEKESAIFDRELGVDVQSVPGPGSTYAGLGEMVKSLGLKDVRVGDLAPRQAWPSSVDLEDLVARFNDHEQKLHDISKRLATLESK